MPSEISETILKGAEYLGLRAEIIDWQNRRWITVGFIFTLFIFAITQIARIKSEVATDILYVNGLSIGFSVYLSVAWAFVIYARNANVLLGTYIDHFLEKVEGEPLWYERRLEVRNANERKYLSIDIIIFALFFILLLATIAASCWVQSPNLELRPLWIAYVPALIFIVMCGICHWKLLLKRNDAMEEWKRVVSP